MDKKEQKELMEAFLGHHGVRMLPTARLSHYGRRFSAFFPSLAGMVNPDGLPWTANRVGALCGVLRDVSASDFKPEFNGQFSGQPAQAPVRSVGKSKLFFSSREWKKMRYLVLTKRGARCECCGTSGKMSKIHVDHIKPISKFWDLRLDESNLQVLCDVCNVGKGNWDQTDHR